MDYIVLQPVSFYEMWYTLGRTDKSEYDIQVVYKYTSVQL